VAERTWEIVERFGTIRRAAIQRQRRENSPIEWCARFRSKVGADSGASTDGTRRGTNQKWYGLADRFPFMACPGAPKIARSKLRFARATRVIALVSDATWVIVRPSAVRSVNARWRLSIQEIVRSFTVSPKGCGPNRGGSAKCAKCGNRSRELNPRPAMAPRRHGPRLARRSSRVHPAFPATVVDSSLA
jgi:hypothetical protein